MKIKMGWDCTVLVLVEKMKFGGIVADTIVRAFGWPQALFP